MFNLGHPEKITDFAWRAMHETVVKAKAITVSFYGNGPKYSYYNGCSTGGRQGLIEATRFPNDFDAISILAYVEVKLQDYRVARELYQRALAIQNSPALRMALSRLPE